MGYFLSISLSIIIPFYSSWNYRVTTIFIVSIILFGSIILITVMFYPYKYRVLGTGSNEMMIGPRLNEPVEYIETAIDPLERKDFEEEIIHPYYYQEIKLKILYYLIIPIIIIYTFVIPLLYLTEGFFSGLLGVITVMFFLSILIIFDRIKIILEQDHLTLRLGPFKDKIKIIQIERLSKVSIRAMRDYFGFGKRLGPDGTIGYIASSGPGVKIWLSTKKYSW